MAEVFGVLCGNQVFSRPKVGEFFSDLFRSVVSSEACVGLHRMFDILCLYVAVLFFRWEEFLWYFKTLSKVRGWPLF